MVKTQFLVFHNQYLNQLALIKVLMYHSMKYHFNYKEYPGINFNIPLTIASAEKREEEFNCDLVRDLNDSLAAFNVKIAAAYARLRIEMKAFGKTSAEQMDNILPDIVRQKEELAGKGIGLTEANMPKTFRISSNISNYLNLFARLHDSGCIGPISAKSNDLDIDYDNAFYVEENFPNMITIASKLYDKISTNKIFTDGTLILQDKASLYAPKHLETIIKPGMHVIEGRAGCGNVFIYYRN